MDLVFPRERWEHIRSSDGFCVYWQYSDAYGFDHLQQALGIWIIPLYLMVFAILNIGLLEIAYHQVMRRGGVFQEG